MLRPKKVGKLAVEGSDEEKQTNEIKIAAPLLDSIEINGRTITADALLTQRELATYIVSREAHYHFTAKANQSTLQADIAYYFETLTATADYISHGLGEHGRIETRSIWVTDRLNSYLNFPHIGQVFRIDREVITKKTGRRSHETVYGITSKFSHQASPAQVLGDNRNHWSVESCHWIIDWNYDEDRSQIRCGHGPENVTRLRRFAIGLLKSKQSTETLPTMMKRLNKNVRAVFDYLKMTRNSNVRSMS